MKKVLFLILFAGIHCAKAQTTFINENFSSTSGTTPPVGWTPFILAGSPLVDSFHFDNPCARVLNAPITSPAAMFDSDCSSNDGAAESVVLISPTFNASAVSVVILEWNQYFRGGFGGQVYVLVSDGVTTDTAFTTTASTPDPDFLSINISARAAGKATVNVIFQWTGDFSWYWIIDNVNVYAPASNDVGVIAIDAPVSGCNLSASENVTVRVKNFGAGAQSNIPVSYSINGGGPVNDTIPATINPGDTLSYTFTPTANLSIQGTYIFDAWTDLTGDVDSTNDSTLNYAVVHATPVTAFPYSEDFEGETLCGNASFACVPDGSCTLTGNWQNGTGDNIDWSTNEGGTPSGPGTGPAADHTTGTAAGNYLFTESSGGCNGQTAILITPCLDISTLANPIFTFWYHMNGLDMGKLYVDIDTGGTWTTADSIIGPQQVVATDPWIIDTVNLLPYSGVLRIRLRGVTGTGFESDMAIDDLEVKDLILNDVGVIAIDSPLTGCGLSASENITIQIFNFGSSVQTSIPVSYTINGGPAVNATVLTTLNPGANMIYTFTTTANLSIPGTYTVNAWTSLTGDGDNTNDSTNNYIVTHLTPVNSFPYIENFESGTLGQFSTNGILGSLDWVNTVIRGSDPGHSATLSAYFGNPVDTTYNTGTTEGSNLQLSCIDLSALTTVRLSFNYFLQTEQFAGFDSASVSISTDGIAFTNLADNQAGGNNNLIDGSGLWQSLDTNISAFGGQPAVYIRFSFNTVDNAANTFEGFYVDDVMIYETLASSNVGVISVNSPVSHCLTGATDSVNITVVNFGATTEDSIPLAYSINGGPSVNDTVFSVMNPGDTLSFTFATGSILSPAGTYLVKSWTALPGDINNANDSSIVTVTIYPLPVINLGADTLVCNGVVAPLNTSNFGYASYSWSNGLTDSTITTDTSGTFALTVTSGNGCFGSDTIIITVNPALALTTGFTNATCGNSDGSASVSVTGGSTPYNYLWNDTAAQTNDTATGLPAGIYTVMVTDTVNCSANTSVSIGNTGAPVVSISSSSNISCFGGNNGSATVSATGGTLPYSYLWNDPGAQTNSTATGLTVGAYFVTVTDSNNCTVIGNVTLTQPTDPLALSTSSQTSNCGLSNGSASVLVSGGTGGYTYLWNDPAAQTNSTAISLSAGTYSVIVRDSNSCLDSASIVVTNIAGGTASVILSNNASCNGVCDGAVTASISGGTAPFTYLWNDPLAQTNSMANGLCAGSFIVTVTDSIGCTGNASITISQPDAIGLSGSTVNATCGNSDGSATVTVTGGTGGYTYLWNDPGFQTNATATGLAAGSYTVTVSDSSGCSNSTIIAVNNVGGPSASILSFTNVTCNGGSNGSATLTASGGTLPYTYLWNDPGAQTTAIASGLTVGVYTATVTDSNGCIATNFATISEPALITSALIANGESCPGSCDGSAAVTVSGGTSPYTYLWNDPAAQTNSTATGLCPGLYSIYIVDANGCTDNDSTTVSTGSGLSIIFSSVDASCGNADGSAIASVTGGTAPYTYLWNDPGAQTTSTANGLTAGVFSVTVIDAGGCTSSGTAIVSDAGAPSLSISASSNVSCSGGNNGNATVSASGGVLPYTYLWNDSLSQTTATATGLIAGNYNVNVTDSNGCTAFASVTITEPSPVILVISGTDATCGGCNNGSATLTASGGTTPYSYLWDDGFSQTTATAAGLTAGIYSVMVTDAGGCSSSASVTINDPAVIFTLTLVITNVSCIDLCNGSATANVTGGSAPYTYQWDDPFLQTTATATGLCKGPYNITVTDATGNSITDFFTIFQPSAMVITTMVNGATCGNADGSVTVTVSGGTPPYSYLWSTGGTSSTETGLSAGTYTLSVTDSKSCVQTLDITVGNSNGPLITVSATNVSCNGAGNGSASAVVSGGIFPYSYIWDDPASQTSSTAYGLNPGNYSVNVTDASGCTNVSQPVSISEPAPMVLSTSTVDATAGACNGSATLTVSGGTLPYTYSWNDPANQTSQTASGLCPGSITVTVTDGNACIITGTNTVSSFTGISGNSEIMVWSVYPNPALTEFTIDLMLAEKENILLTVYNISAQVVYSNNLENVNRVKNKVVTEKWLPGIYFIEIRSNSKNYITKIAVN